MSIAPEAYQDVWRAVCQTPGLTLENVAPDERMAQGAAYELSVDGWSPSLHFIQMQWISRVDPGAPETLATRIVNGIRSQLAIQSRRAREGLEVGTALPFRIDGDLMRIERLAHMHMDATAAAVLLRDGREAGWDIEKIVRNGIQRQHDALHKGAIDHRGGRRLADQGVAVADEMGVRFFHTCSTFGKGASLDGEVLTVTCPTVPDTALVAMSGRPVTAFADVDEAVNRRTVTRAEAHDGFVALHLEARRIRVSDLLAGAEPDTGGG